ncbi:MAG: hypothetical protein LAO18_10590 [Acidobacteriia bacterium]|nr:hypothetical protein [Terriglobia bacterium]
MRTWKMIAVVNGAGVVGIIISLFIVSPHTPLWLFAVVSAVVLGAMNYACVGVGRTASGERKSGIKSTVVIALGFIVLLLELFFRYWHQ